MIVGINYPWENYGWDFGGPVGSWGPCARWRSTIDASLSRFVAAGIEIVRWFILADGLTVGSGREAPHLSGNQWRFDSIPDLSSEALEQFDDMLQRFARTDMRLLPVLIDFHWAFPGLDRASMDRDLLARWQGKRELSEPNYQSALARARTIPEGFVKGGRADAIRDPRKSAALFRNVLQPLLQVSRRTTRAIYCWELINEPEWITHYRGSGRSRRDDDIPLSEMLNFIVDGCEMIRDYGFPATIGFAKYETIPQWEGAWHSRRARMTMRRIEREPSSLGMDIHQSHYYPRSDDHVLRSALPGPRPPAILGEFSTRTDGVPGSVWPELPTEQRGVAARLALARERGYRAALPWSFKANDGQTDPNFIDLEAAIADYYRV